MIPEAAGSAEPELGNLAPEHVRSPRYTWTQGRSWEQTGAHRFPENQGLFDDDLRGLIRDWVLPGHAPPTGMLTLDAPVVTLGSCFARELRRHLAAAGVGGGNVWIPSGLNNTFAILDFISWCVTGSETGRGYRYDRDDEGKIREWTPEWEREQCVQALREAGAFVFTFGLAEVWQDRETGGVFWRGVPKDVYRADRHVFRLTSVDENEANIVHIVQLVRSTNAGAPIILTLSPVPLRATFRDVSCLTADSVSKSVLRVALDQAMSHRLDNVWYWPSYEIVRWVGAHAPWRAFGEDEGKPRDVSRRVVSTIIESFLEAFFTNDALAGLHDRHTT